MEVTGPFSPAIISFSWDATASDEHAKKRGSCEGGATYMVAVTGHGGTGLLAGLNQSGALLDHDLLSIDGNLDFSVDAGRSRECSCGVVDKAASCDRLKCP